MEVHKMHLDSLCRRPYTSQLGTNEGQDENTSNDRRCLSAVRGSRSTDEQLYRCEYRDQFAGFAPGESMGDIAGSKVHSGRESVVGVGPGHRLFYVVRS